MSCSYIFSLLAASFLAAENVDSPSAGLALSDPVRTLKDFRSPACVPREAVKGFLWLEAEAFADYGGWRIDTQFVQQMGSAYLIAPGVLKPVPAARTEIFVPSAGTWRVWVRTRDWLPEFSPGTFALELGGRRSKTLGASKQEGWRWETAGDFDLPAGSAGVSLVDLGAGYARCDAIVLTTDLAYVPPISDAELKNERRRLRGLSQEVADGGAYDVVVVGAGPGGLGAAIAAARHGARTLLVHDRPVLGGNNSLEQTVSAGGSGHNRHMGFVNARESGIMEESRLLRQVLKVRQPGVAYRRLVDAEDRLTERPNERVVSARAEDGRVRDVVAESTLTGDRIRYRGTVFVDATGDGWVGVFVGASRMSGREAASEYGEKNAPEKADGLMMSGSVAEYAFHRTGRDDGYETPVWARVLPEGFDRPNIRDLRQKWWLEHANSINELADPECARDELIRINLAYWGWLRGHPTLGAQARQSSLDEVRIHNGRREGWRLVGDYVMTATDCRKGTLFPDAIATGGWHLDLHDPHGVTNPKGDGRWSQEPLPLYTIPYRSVYSKDFANLYMAGRNISVTHLALGTTRLMGTILAIGQAVGTAAAMASAEGRSARDVGRTRIGELQRRLLCDDQFILGFRYEDPANVAPHAKVTATSVNGAVDTKPEYAVDGVLRPAIRKDEKCTYAWQADPQAKLPQELRLDLDKPTAVREIRLVFDSGLHGGEPERPRPRVLVRDYAVFGLSGGEWKKLAETKDNCRRLAVHCVDGRVLSSIRVSVGATWGLEPRIQEVMVLESETARRREDEQVLLEGWRFSNGDREDATEASLDDSSWEVVRIPHDWAIDGPFNRTNDLQIVKIEQDGDVVAREHTGRTAGLPWVGVGWYRRTVELPAETRTAELVFDGAMSHAEVYSDGQRIGGCRNGYAPFVVPLPVKSRQTIAVRLENLPESSRWYPGAGLIRPVTLRIDPKVRPEEVFVRTERIADGKAYMRVTAPGGDRTFTIDAPKLWTPESPYLYMLEPEGVRYGVRTVEWRKGAFELNGCRRKIKGVCLHHDLGPLGAAFNRAAFRRQLRILKEGGCDAIRTAHNIPSSWQLDICDEEGVMVVAESFDEWSLPKCKNGGNLSFREDWRHDLEALVRFHRNHPSVIMWSIGNEVPDQSRPEGAKTCRELQDLCHRLDPTRPVTMGVDRLRNALDNGLVSVLDIPGLNYRLSFYPEAYRQSSCGLVLGSETASTISSRGVYKLPVMEEKDAVSDDGQCSSYDMNSCSWSNLPDDDWKIQDENPWVIGEFVWTGFDYLGEPTPYKEYWPSRSSYFGMVDLAGIPKDRYWLYRSRWNAESPTLHVLPHWTWPGREGKTTPVYVYTSYPEAELFVNGRSQGRRRFDRSSRLDRYRLRWSDVAYQPGELKVVAYDAAGNAVAEKTVRTAGVPHHLDVTADRTRLSPPSDQETPDLGFVTVRIVDKDGNVCPDADMRVNFATEGSVGFKTACNGDATSLEPFHLPTMKAFHGELVAIVEPVSVGKGRLLVKAEGLQDAVCGISVTHSSREK